MLLKTVMTGLAAATLLAITASAPVYATPVGGAHGAGNWPMEGTWNYPVTCKWVPVKVYVHKQPTWQWVKQCQ